MGMKGAVSTVLEDGKKLHLHHGPIDLIVEVDADRNEIRDLAFAAAANRFDTLLNGLVGDLNQLRSELRPGDVLPNDPVARRMVEVTRQFSYGLFMTPMIAVAGSVAEEILDAMVSVQPLRRAYVNNGGDIALHLEPGEKFAILMSDLNGQGLGRIEISHDDPVRGIATSGSGGRSHSFGIADSVTVLAASAAVADTAATLIANAVNLPNHSGIVREQADLLLPDSDLGSRKVVVEVPELNRDEKLTALDAGVVFAKELLDSERIAGAALFLQQESVVVGKDFGFLGTDMELENV